MMFERGLGEKVALPERLLNCESCLTSALATAGGVGQPVEYHPRSLLGQFS